MENFLKGSKRFMGFCFGLVTTLTTVTSSQSPLNDVLPRFIHKSVYHVKGMVSRLGAFYFTRR